MVVTFDNAERNAKLSLRQSEILAKLQTIVDDIACGCEKCVSHLFSTLGAACDPLAYPESLCPPTTLNMDGSCSNRRLGPRTLEV